LGSRLAVYAGVEKVRVRGFKSLLDVELELNNGVNLLVGPNASGKSNIIESLWFLRRALVEAPREIPYAPHLPRYGSAEDLFFYRDVSRPIEYELWLKVYPVVGDTVYEHRLVYRVVFRFKPPGGLEPAMHSLELDGLKLEVTEGHLKVRVSRHLVEYVVKAGGIEESKLGHVEELLEKATVVDGYYEFRVDVGDYGAGILRGFLGLEGIPGIIMPRSSLSVEGYEGLLVVEACEVLGIPLLFVVRASRSSLDASRVARLPVRSLAASIKPYVATLLSVVREAVDRVVAVKHPDMSAVRRSQPLLKVDRLEVDASNLPAYLYKVLAERGIPESLELLLEKLFPGVKLKVKTVYGNSILVFEERGVELGPHNLPDGLIKLIALTLAAESKPSILLVDEVENSLHAEAIKAIYSFLNSQSYPVILATHNPILVDLAGPERLLLTARDEMGATRVSRIEDPGGLKKKLVEAGVALSEYIFEA